MLSSDHYPDTIKTGEHLSVEYRVRIGRVPIAMTTVAQKLCPLCTFEAPTVTIVLSHLRAVHSSDPHFRVTCGLDGCLTTSSSFSALYSHIYRHHPGIVKKRKESFPASSQETGGLNSQSRLDTGSDLTGTVVHCK